MTLSETLEDIRLSLGDSAIGRDLGQLQHWDKSLSIACEIIKELNGMYETCQILEKDYFMDESVDNRELRP